MLCQITDSDYLYSNITFMTTLIKQATIISPSSSWHNKQADLLIEDGIIKEISTEVKASVDHTIEEKDLHVSIGWFDLRANYGEPGEEHKETIHTGLKAAQAGGFTGVGILPNTTQPADKATTIDFIKNRPVKSTVERYPYGALSEHLKGKDLAEMADMSSKGAIGFTDDKNYVNTSLISRGMLYAKTFNHFVSVFPSNNYLSNGHVHEGIVSTKMGLKGIPVLAETMEIEKYISLAAYHDAPIHFSTISTAKSVELIREAKKKGLNITCDVAAHQLYFTDEATKSYDANFKVNPPFRSKNDIDGLIQGLKDGTIDAICSDHQPHDIESKRLEFEYASFGIIGQETAFGALYKVLKSHLSLEKIIELITENPRQILRLDIPKIAEGEKANLTLFSPSTTWRFEEKHIQSLSKNTPFIGEELTGKVIDIIV